MLTPDQKNILRAIIDQSVNRLATQEATATLSDADAEAKINTYIIDGKAFWTQKVSVLQNQIVAFQSQLATANSVLASINAVQPPPITG